LIQTRVYKANLSKGTKKIHIKNLWKLNAFQIDKDGMKCLLVSNFADFDFLFLNQHLNTSSCFQRALGLAKKIKKLARGGKGNQSLINTLREIILRSLFDASPDKKKKKYNDYGTWKFKVDNRILG
jgi:hypothetical protein